MTDRNEIMLVDPAFKQTAFELKDKFNKELEKMVGFKFKSKKPVTAVDVTRLIAGEINPKKLQKKVEVDLKKFKLKI